MRRNLRDRILDGSNPAFRISLLVACIVQRQDFLFEDAVNGSGIQLVLVFLVLVSTFFRQRPTCTFTVAFQPPSVEYGEVYNTVHQRLLTGSTGCFERTCRSVQPDIHTRYEAACQLHIVVFEEDNLTQELGTAGDFDDSLNQSLTCAVRVSLTCKQELYRIIGVVHNLRQTVQVGEQQVRTLISSETTPETNQQRIRVNLVQQRYNA